MTIKTYTEPEELEDLLTRSLQEEIQTRQKQRKYGHDSTFADGRISGLLGALYFLTDEDHGVIQARAEQAGAADQSVTGETQIETKTKMGDAQK